MDTDFTGTVFTFLSKSLIHMPFILTGINTWPRVWNYWGPPTWNFLNLFGTLLMFCKVVFQSSEPLFAIATEVGLFKRKTSILLNTNLGFSFFSQTDCWAYHLQISKSAATKPRKGWRLQGMKLYFSPVQTCCAVERGNALHAAGHTADCLSPSRGQLPFPIGVMECATYLLSLFRLSVGCWYCPFILLSLLQHTHIQKSSHLKLPKGRK